MACGGDPCDEGTKKPARASAEQAEGGSDAGEDADCWSITNDHVPDVHNMAGSSCLVRINPTLLQQRRFHLELDESRTQDDVRRSAWGYSR